MNSAKAFPLAMDNSTTYMMCHSLLLVTLSTCTCKLIFSVNSKPHCLSNRAFSSDLQGRFEKYQAKLNSINLMLYDKISSNCSYSKF